MKFLRNPEIRTGLILHAAATLLVTFAAWLYDSSLWTAAFAIGVLFTLLHLTITFIRYRIKCVFCIALSIPAFAKFANFIEPNIPIFFI